MTREQALAEVERLSRAQPEARWLARESRGGWQIVRLQGAGLAPTAPTGTATEARVRPEPADPRPFKDVPPFGAGP